jgi:hypothetical protein
VRISEGHADRRGDYRPADGPSPSACRPTRACSKALRWATGDRTLRRLPVVDAAGRPVGKVSLATLPRAELRPPVSLVDALASHRDLVEGAARVGDRVLVGVEGHHDERQAAPGTSTALLAPARYSRALAWASPRSSKETFARRVFVVLSTIQPRNWSARGASRALPRSPWTSTAARIRTARSSTFTHESDLPPPPPTSSLYATARRRRPHLVLPDCGGAAAPRAQQAPVCSASASVAATPAREDHSPSGGDQRRVLACARADRCVYLEDGAPSSRRRADRVARPPSVGGIGPCHRVLAISVLKDGSEPSPGFGSEPHAGTRTHGKPLGSAGKRAEAGPGKSLQIAGPIEVLIVAD